jgi:hypothetical protein
MSHDKGGHVRLLVLILLGIVATAPAFGWIDRYGSTGNARARDGAGTDGYPGPVIDVFFSIFAPVLSPVSTGRASVARDGATDASPRVVPAVSFRAPPSP